MSRQLHLVFREVGPMVAAVRALHEDGVTGMDVHTPWRIPTLEAILEPGGQSVRRVMLIGGLCAAAGILALQVWSSLWLYPLNFGGRPLFSWPAFGFATFESGILGAAATGFAAMIRRCGLPRPHHPFFATAQTEAATNDRLYITVPADRAPDRMRLSQLDGLVGIVETGT